MDKYDAAMQAARLDRLSADPNEREERAGLTRLAGALTLFAALVVIVHFFL